MLAVLVGCAAADMVRSVIRIFEAKTMAQHREVRAVRW
jgi:hypothetical protein